jgi:hypothetical protein
MNDQIPQILGIAHDLFQAGQPVAFHAISTRLPRYPLLEKRQKIKEVVARVNDEQSAEPAAERTVPYGTGAVDLQPSRAESIYAVFGGSHAVGVITATPRPMSRLLGWGVNPQPVEDPRSFIKSPAQQEK